ncbi:MAG TPA: dTMP kinase [Thermopetrobacter sp.]|nr:dTMP kinase [Thermopetrobacter sp.]
MAEGTFITFEGGEGAGKSLQVTRLAERLRAAGRKVVTTREPGGTEMGGRIRALLVTGDPDSLDSTAEALLNYAAREMHLRDVIRPALAEGKVVISDRFMDSTRAYQGYAGDCPLALIEALERDVVGGTKPDLTFILDIDPAEGLARTHGRGNGEDRFERFGLAFHEKLRAAFLRIAEENPQRCVVIDATRPWEQVAADIWREMEKLLDGAS